MFKVLIVDDDLLIRTNLKIMLNQEDNDFALCGEAANGLEALEIMEKEMPDIVLSDIQMPLMDGVQLSETIKRNYPDMKLIVLSNYDDLEYVKATLKNGAVDYILKHKINETVLNDAIGKAKDEILQSSKNRSGKFEYKNQVYNNMIALREKFIIQLLIRAYTHEYEIKKHMELLEINIDAKNILAVIMELDDYKTLTCDSNLKDRNQTEFAIINILEEILRDYDNGTVAHISAERFVILLSFAHYRSQAMITNHIDSLLERIGGCLKKFMGISASFSVGSMCESIENISQSYEYAEKCLKSKFLLGKSKVMKDSQVSEEKRQLVVLDIEKEEQILTHIKIQNEKEVISDLGGIFDYIKTNKLNYNSSQMQINDLVGIVNRVCKEYGIELSLIYLEENPYETLIKLETLDELRDWIINLYKRLLEVLRSKGDEEVYSEYVKKAIKFIKAHFSENISLGDVARDVNIISSYLSKLFKEEVGKGFSEYIIDLRIERAKQLLKEGKLELKDIIKVCGFNSYNYFFKIFKEKTGITPRVYIEQCRN